MSRVYEDPIVQYDYLAEWKCVLIKWNSDLGKVLLNPSNADPKIFFNLDDLKTFCSKFCPRKMICEDAIKDEILNLMK